MARRPAPSAHLESQHLESHKRADASPMVERMTPARPLLAKPNGAYYNEPLPSEDAQATHVEKGSPGGEYLRRFWQPIALTSEVGELPIKVRMFGEDLILFRTT